MAEYFESDELRELADKVIDENQRFSHLKDKRCRIAFQYSSDAKHSGGKTVYADTEKVKDKYKKFMPYDFVITFYGGNTDGITEESMYKLMYHELNHVGFDPDDEKYSILPHDIEDFTDVVDKWGVRWMV